MQHKPLILALLAGLTLSGAAQAALESRLNGAAVYDTDLNITWLSNANLIASNTFGLNYGQTYGYDNAGIFNAIYSDGIASWGGAQTWIAAMNTANYLGYSDWALPTTTGDCSIYNCTDSQMGHLFYTEGGLSAGQSILSSAALTSKFSNFQSSVYWSGSEFALGPDSAWSFGMNDGYQNPTVRYNSFYAMAVRPGDVAAVPEADTWAMLLAGLGLVGVVVRRRRG
jgi:hypothetical protein